MAGISPSDPIPDPVPQERIQSKFDEIEYSGRKAGPFLAVLLSIIAATWSVFQLWIASPLPFQLGFGIVDGVPARGVHLAFGLLLTFLMFPVAKSMANKSISILDVAFALFGIQLTCR